MKSGPLSPLKPEVRISDADLVLLMTALAPDKLTLLEGGKDSRFVPGSDIQRQRSRYDKRQIGVLVERERGRHSILGNYLGKLVFI